MDRETLVKGIIALLVVATFFFIAMGTTRTAHCSSCPQRSCFVTVGCPGEGCFCYDPDGVPGTPGTCQMMGYKDDQAVTR